MGNDRELCRARIGNGLCTVVHPSWERYAFLFACHVDAGCGLSLKMAMAILCSAWAILFSNLKRSFSLNLSQYHPHSFVFSHPSQSFFFFSSCFVMAIAYPVASSSSVYCPSSSITSAYLHSTTASSSVVYKPATSYTKSGDYTDDDELYTSYMSAKKGVLTTSSTQYTTICKTSTVSGTPFTYTTVYDLLNNCYPTVTVTQTVTQAEATPVAAIATTVPYKPAQSEYAQYGRSFLRRHSLPVNAFSTSKVFICHSASEIPSNSNWHY